MHLSFDYTVLKVNLTESVASKDARLGDLESELGRMRAKSDRLLQVSFLMILRILKFIRFTLLLPMIFNITLDFPLPTVS